ncbi:hypothetical protein JYB87_04375 [Shewanella avicenniae]|uniref:Nif11 domain-containing protein n=1 Tax=Shewanella avicenniae TaxID=2814294 RepID=A0ABX7QTZ0_9GAMM|nr:hypothetical protein [Shewanella avicenniae]QSX34492.1 hypothetical protein JYB87_04375 [Shewanella avicenniae]
MNNKLVNFLAQVGADVSLQQPEALAQAALAAGFEPQQIAALLNNDAASFAEELKINTDIVCFLAPAEPDEDEQGEQPKEDDTDTKNASLKIA